MRNYFKVMNKDEDVVVFNMDKLVGKVFFAMTVVGIVTTVKGIKKLVNKKGELKYVKY